MKLKTLLFASIASAAFIATATAAPFLSIQHGILAATGDTGVVFNVYIDPSITSPPSVVFKEYWVSKKYGKDYADPMTLDFNTYPSWSFIDNLADITAYQVTEEGVSLWYGGKEINNCHTKVSSGSNKVVISSNTANRTRSLIVKQDNNGNYSCQVS